MNLQNSSTALFVKDIEASKYFYINVLGLKVELDFGKNVTFSNGFAIWEIRENHIIPGTLGIHKVTDVSVTRFELYFETEDLPREFEALKSKNVRFLHEAHEETWGQRTIRFFDPDNHLTEIGESMKQFVCRFYNQGPLIEEVSSRTHVPLEEVKRLINNV